MPDGGLVPKSLYKEEYQDKSPEGPPLSVDSCYNTSHVVKDFPHEVRNQHTLCKIYVKHNIVFMFTSLLPVY